MIDHRLILVLGIFLLSQFAGLSPTTKEEEEMSGQLRDLILRQPLPSLFSINNINSNVLSCILFEIAVVM